MPEPQVFYVLTTEPLSLGRDYVEGEVLATIHSELSLAKLLELLTKRKAAMIDVSGAIATDEPFDGDEDDDACNNATASD